MKFQNFVFIFIDHQIWFLLLKITHVLQTIYFVFTSLLHISVNRRIKIGLRAFWRERLIAYHYQLEPGLTKQRYIYSAFCFIYTLRILLMNNLTFVGEIKNSHSCSFYSILHFIINLNSETSNHSFLICIMNLIWLWQTSKPCFLQMAYSTTISVGLWEY